MNAMLPLFATAGTNDPAAHKAANILAAARALTPQLNRSRTLDRRLVANTMTMAFGGSDADAAWIWRDAYDAVEAALVLQLRRLSPQISRLEDGPAEICALLANLAELGLTHTRRSEEQVALDQFSTPPQLGALRCSPPRSGPATRCSNPRPSGRAGGSLRSQRDPERDRRSARRDPGGPVCAGGVQRSRRPASEGRDNGVRQLPRRGRQPALPGAGRAPARSVGHPGRRRPAVGDRVDAAD